MRVSTPVSGAFDTGGAGLSRALAAESPLRFPPADPNDAAPLPFDPVLVAAGINVAVRSFFRRLFGWRRHSGDAAEICRQVVDSCWTGEFFAGSDGHFKQFWTRDLSMCAPALCRLGRREQVVQSLEWGLARFERAGRITTTIFNRRFPRDVYAYASDSLPMLLFALRTADATHLIDRHRDLLARETERYLSTVFDPELGLARASGYFSGPRDCMTGRSTVFANTMIALLIRMLDVDGRLPNPLAGYDLPALIRRQYWTGELFPGLAVPGPSVGRRQRLAIFLRRHRRPRYASSGPWRRWRRAGSTARCRCAISSGRCPRRSCRCRECSRPTIRVIRAGPSSGRLTCTSWPASIGRAMEQERDGAAD